MKIGEKIKARRKEIGLTLDQLTAMSGVSKATLSRIENGVNDGNVVTLKKIALSLRVGFDELVSESKRGATALQGEDTARLDFVERELKDLMIQLKKIFKVLNINE